MVPDRGASRDQQPALLGIVPLGQTTTLVQTVFLLASTVLSVGRRRPFSGERPRCPFLRGGAGLYKAASSRRPGDHTNAVADRGQQFERREAAVGDEESRRLGNQRLVCRIACRAQSVSVLCRKRCFSLHRADGASMVRNGSAQCRADQRIGTTTISDSQRRPLVLTKCPFEDRTGSR